MLKVKCIQNGYIGHKRKYVGQVFFIEEKAYSKVWMEKLDADNTEPVSKDTRVDKSYSMERLFDYCKTHKLKNYSGLEHLDLVDAINSGDLDPVDTFKEVKPTVKESKVDSKVKPKPGAKKPETKMAETEDVI